MAVAVSAVAGTAWKWRRAGSNSRHVMLCYNGAVIVVRVLVVGALS